MMRNLLKPIIVGVVSMFILTGCGNSTKPLTLKTSTVSQTSRQVNVSVIPSRDPLFTSSQYTQIQGVARQGSVNIVYLPTEAPVNDSFQEAKPIPSQGSSIQLIFRNMTISESTHPDLLTKDLIPKGEFNISNGIRAEYLISADTKALLLRIGQSKVQVLIRTKTLSKDTLLEIAQSF